MKTYEMLLKEIKELKKSRQFYIKSVYLYIEWMNKHNHFHSIEGKKLKKQLDNIEIK